MKTRMTRKEAEQGLSDLYGVHPEADIIEEALYWAGRQGRGFIGGHVVTYDGVSFEINKRGNHDGGN